MIIILILQRLIACIIYRKEQRRNYAYEGVNLQIQLKMLLSDRLKQQVIWGRFVNTSGGKGRNVSCDLHMEHLNRSVCMYYVVIYTYIYIYIDR